MPNTRDTRSTPIRTSYQWSLAALPILLAVVVHDAVTKPLLDEETERLLVKAVTAAADLDLYNARCRGDQSGRPIDDLNKELVGKLGMTVLGVEDDLFPERGYRRVQQRLQQDFLTRLKDAGGCQGAKDSGLPDILKQDYRRHLDAVRDLP